MLNIYCAYPVKRNTHITLTLYVTATSIWNKYSFGSCFSSSSHLHVQWYIAITQFHPDSLLTSCVTWVGCQWRTTSSVTDLTSLCDWLAEVSTEGSQKNTALPGMSQQTVLFKKWECNCRFLFGGAGLHTRRSRRCCDTPALSA